MALAKVVSIQVQTTIQTPDEIQTCDAANSRATHWSVYTRAQDGMATWVKDFPLSGGSFRKNNTGTAKTGALVCAAELSIQHSAFIEHIVGEEQ